QIESIHFPSGLHYLFYELYRSLGLKKEVAYGLLLSSSETKNVSEYMKKPWVHLSGTSAFSYWNSFENDVSALYTRWTFQIREQKRTRIKNHIQKVIQNCPIDFLVYTTRGVDPKALLPQDLGHYDQDILHSFEELWKIDSPFLQSQRALYGKDSISIQKVVHSLHEQFPPKTYINDSSIYEIAKMIYLSVQKFDFVQSRLPILVASPEKQKEIFSFVFPDMAFLSESKNTVVSVWMKDTSELLEEKSQSVSEFLTHVYHTTIQSRKENAKYTKNPAKLFDKMTHFLVDHVLNPTDYQLKPSDIKKKLTLAAEIFLGHSLPPVKTGSDDFRLSSPRAPLKKNKNMDQEDIQNYFSQQTFP
ncbi:hypothetical protein EBS02_12510, partial [bacterium]|nr:hypothetical protein [bacterium]